MLKKLKNSSSVIIIILILFHLIVNIIWINLNNAPPAWDEANHTRLSFEFLHSFQNLASGNFNLKESLPPFFDAYGPLIRFFTGFLLFVFEPSIKLAQFVGTIFFLLSILMTYLLGKVIFRNKWVGILAAFIFSFYLIVYDNSRWLLLDIGMVFFILLSIYWLIKGNFFEDKKYSIFTFLSLSLVALTKLQGLIYFIFPFGYSLFLIIKNKKIYRFRNIFLGAFGFISLISLWLVPNWERIIRYYSVATKAEPFVDPTKLTDLTTWFHYLKLFIDYEIEFFVFLFFLVSLFYYLKSKANLKVFPLFFIAFYYVLFTLFPNKDMRYLFPILPFTALVFAWGFFQFHRIHKSLAKLAIMSIFIFNIIFYFTLSFGFPFKKGLRKQIELPFIKDIVYLNVTEYPVRKFDSGKWPTEKMVYDVAILDEGRKKVLVGVDHERVNNSNLALFLSKNRIQSIEFSSPFGIYEFKENKLNDYIQTFDYAIVPEEDINPFYLFNKKALDQIREYFISANKTPILRYQLPTGKNIFVFGI